MKVYKNRNDAEYYYILIEYDSGEVRIAFISKTTVTEYLAEITEARNGFSRIIFGGGSSMPYKDSNGKLCNNWIEI